MSGCPNADVKARDLWRDVSWFAIHAKPRRESFASQNIDALGIEWFFPQFKVTYLVRGVTQQATKSLFPGYFFARFCPESSFELVKGTRGVLRVVSSGRFPAPVDESIVAEIRSRIQQDGFVRIDLPTLRPGDRVSIQCSPFEGLMGRVERELDDRKRVAILLETLLPARVLVERQWVRTEAA